MDPKRFDTLTKTLSVSSTRRRIVRLLAILPLGVTLGARLGRHAATAANKTSMNKKQQQDDDHGSSHRQHRRKAEHRHQTGKDKENRKGQRKRKGKKKDPINFAPSECAGKADRTCCGGTGQWCQAGACVAIPDGSVATLVECGGRCNCPSSNPSCLGDFEAHQPVCGKVLTCTSCVDCESDSSSCTGFVQGNGPEGDAAYYFTEFIGVNCFPVPPSGFDHNQCPNPATQACVFGVCTNICYG